MSCSENAVCKTGVHPSSGKDKTQSDALRIPITCFLIAVWLLFSHIPVDLTAKESFVNENRSSAESAKKIREMENALLEFTNRERSRAGLPSFRLSPALSFLARGQSKNMCARKILEHESEQFPQGWRKFSARLKKAGLRAGGENVAYRTFSGRTEAWARHVVEGWMSSPPHRKNILNPNFAYMGAGIEMCSRDLAYATQVFSPDPGRLP